MAFNRATVVNEAVASGVYNATKWEKDAIIAQALLKAGEGGGGGGGSEITEAVEQSPTNLLFTLSSTSPENIIATETFVRAALIYGYNAFTSGEPTDNAGNVFLGVGATFLPTIIKPGDEIVISAAYSGLKFDLNEYFLKGAVNDGIFIQYWQ